MRRSSSELAATRNATFLRKAFVTSDRESNRHARSGVAPGRPDRSVALASGHAGDCPPAWTGTAEKLICDAKNTGLAALKNLTTLKIESNPLFGGDMIKVTNAGIAELQKALPNCKIER